MFEPYEPLPVTTGEMNVPETVVQPQQEVASPESSPATPSPAGQASDGESRRWHAEAGRKGAHRVHQLVQEGKLYEQEHGLKRGRQRRRQLIELGKLYEAEHGLRPERRKGRGKRLSRGEREELLTTLLRCLVRIVKPSFRADLVRLVEGLQADQPRPDETA